MSRVKVLFEGEVVDADQIPFDVQSGKAGIYKLNDGTMMTVAHTVRSVFRLVDRKKEDGTPIYLLTGGVDISFSQE